MKCAWHPSDRRDSLRAKRAGRLPRKRGAPERCWLRGAFQVGELSDDEATEYYVNRCQAASGD